MEFWIDFCQSEFISSRTFFSSSSPPYCNGGNFK
uniref:Uncharacterized protein n=1 Tax=Picea sitchensis TaxID=3332 RepID=A9NR39_PICSI|nr:unknown [Picea sitchensis]